MENITMQMCRDAGYTNIHIEGFGWAMLIMLAFLVIYWFSWVTASIFEAKENKK